MAIQLVKRIEEYKYIPIDERGDKKPTTFYFKPMTKEQKARLEDKLVKVNPDETVNVANATYVLNAVKLCLTKVENLLGEDKKPVDIERCKDGTVCGYWLDMLPEDVVNELGQTIINVSKYPDKAELFLGE
jgi:hypothetical protein